MSAWSSIAKVSNAKRAFAATLAVAGTGLAFASPAAAASWVPLQLDSDSCWDAWVIDNNYNGYNEDQWFDLDNDCAPDTNLYNSAGADNFLETILFDMNEDGRWEIWLADNNQREGFDVVYFDHNGDGRSDKSMSLAPATSTQSLFDAINANNGYYHTDISMFSQFKAATSGTLSR